MLNSYSLQPCWFPMMFDIGYNKVLSGQISAKGLSFMQAYVYPYMKKNSACKQDHMWLII